MLLARGSVVLVDPHEEVRTGLYVMLFYEEGSPEPMLRLTVGPRMKLTEQRDEVKLDRHSIARRVTMARPSVAAAFDLTSKDQPARAITFDNDDVAQGFRRDFCVRQRLVAVSLKTSRGMQAIDMLQDEFEVMRVSGFFNTLWRWSFQAAMLFMVAICIHACLLYAGAPKGGNFFDSASVALREARLWIFAAGNVASDASVAVCSAVQKGVPLDAVERCASLPIEVGESSVRRCMLSVISKFAP